MADQLSTAMKAELQKSSPSIFVFAEIDYPDGTVRYAKSGVNSSTLGIIESRVLKFGSISNQIDPIQSNLSAVSTTIRIIDNDYAFQNRLGRGLRIANSAARIYLASPNVPRSGWFQRFGGILTSWSSADVNQWDLKIQTPDIRLETLFPRYQVNRFDFANVDKGAIGTSNRNRRLNNAVTLGGYTPLIYGKHDDWSDQSAGAIPLTFVDSTTNKYLVSIGYVNVLRVYVDGVRQSTGFAVSRSTINGRFYTLVTFTLSQSGKTVTADVEGYEGTGDGTGSMLCSPIDVIQHIITNFVLVDYQRGNWLTTDTTILDTTYNATTKTALAERANGSGYMSARYISNQLMAKQAVTELCVSCGLIPTWSYEGKLRLLLNDPNKSYPNTYVNDPWVKWEQIKRYSWDYKADRQASRVTASYQNMAAGGSGVSTSNTVPKDFYQIEVLDPQSQSIKNDEITLTWGPSTYP